MSIDEIIRLSDPEEFMTNKERMGAMRKICELARSMKHEAAKASEVRTPALKPGDINATENGSSMGYAEPDRTAARPEQPVQKPWDYCPECGDEEYVRAYGGSPGERVCLKCSQSWFPDVDYTNAVRGNLAERHSKRESVSPDELARLQKIDWCVKQSGEDITAKVWREIHTAPRSIGEQIMVSDGEHVVPAEWTGDEFCYHNITCHAMFDWFEPTHWRPLPPPSPLPATNDIEGGKS